MIHMKSWAYAPPQKLSFWGQSKSCYTYNKSAPRPPCSLEQGHTKSRQYLLWTGKRDLSDEIVSIIFLRGRKPSTDLTDVKRKKIFVSPPRAEIATKKMDGNGRS